MAVNPGNGWCRNLEILETFIEPWMTAASAAGNLSRKGARDGVVSEVSAARAADPGSEVISRQSEHF
jgi:hypothetical protein